MLSPWTKKDPRKTKTEGKGAKQPVLAKLALRKIVSGKELEGKREKHLDPSMYVKDGVNCLLISCGSPFFR